MIFSMSFHHLLGLLAAGQFRLGNWGAVQHHKGRPRRNGLQHFLKTMAPRNMAGICFTPYSFCFYDKKTNLWGSQRNTTNQHQAAHLPCRRWLGVTAPSFGWALALQRPLHAGRCRRWPTVQTGAQWSSTRILEQLGESPKLVTCRFLSFEITGYIYIIIYIASKYGDTVT